MRFSIYILPPVLLVLFSFWLSIQDCGFLSKTFYFLFAGIFLLFLRIVLNVIFLKNLKRNDGSKLILQTVSTSHFSEKVRWCMDLLKIDYVEEQDIAIAGLMFFARSVPTLIYPGVGSISNSSDILRYLWGKNSNNKTAKFLEPTIEALKLEEKFDLLGKSVQTYTFYHFTKPENKKTLLHLWGFDNENIPIYQKLVFLIITPMLRLFMIKGLPLTEQKAIEGKEHIIECFKFVENILKEKQTKYLLGDELSFVDITFCSLVYPILLDNSFGGGAVPENTIPTEKDIVSISELKQFRESLLKSEASKYFFRIYADHRNIKKKI